MKRKVVMKLAMLSLVSLFTVCASAASASAQLINPLRAKIPFEFSMGDKKLPAGEYILSRPSGFGDSKTLLISSVDSSTRLFQLTLPTRVLTPKNESSLVFHKYGDQYFLETIWSGGEQAGAQVPESRSERTIRSQLAQTQQRRMTGKVMKVETVDIVASLL